ncbi:hypothetical protein LguiB_024111 [Lonicera macranthoides]
MFQKITYKATRKNNDGDGEKNPEVLERNTNEFYKLLKVFLDEKDRVQRVQVVDQSAIAIVTTRAPLKESLPPPIMEDDSSMQGLRPSAACVVNLVYDDDTSMDYT